MQITITIEATPENLDRLKALCDDYKPVTIETKKTKKKAETVSKKDSATIETSNINASADATEPTKEKTEEKITKTDVRAVALKISKAGKSDTLREIFSKFGATNLKGIAEEDYEALMRELVAVNV